MLNFTINRLFKQSVPLYSLFTRSRVIRTSRQNVQLYNLTSKPLVVLDFETTGTSSNSSIREIGAIKVKDGVIIDSYHALVKPKDGDNLHEYTKLMTRTREAFPDLVDFCSGSYIVAHNASFERRFLMQIYEKVQASTLFKPQNVFCTYRLATKIFPEQENYKLSPLAIRLGLSFPSALKSHRALDDVFKTKLLWDRFIDYLRERGVTSEHFQECLYNIQNSHKDLTEQIIQHYVESIKNNNNKTLR